MNHKNLFLVTAFVALLVMAGAFFLVERRSAVVNPPVVTNPKPMPFEIPVESPSEPPAAMGKINIDEVCNGALAYMTFVDSAAANAFVEDCKAGNRPEVIEQYKASLNLDAGVAI